MPSFNPANIVQNYVGSAGGSSASMSYSFDVPAGTPDAGQAFAVNVHETNANGGCGSYDLVVSSNLPFAFRRPAVEGTPATGDTLTTDDGGWRGAPTFTRQWLRCNTAGAACTAIPGATAQQYVVQSADVGSRLRVRVTANEGTDNSSTSLVTAIVKTIPEAFFEETHSLVAGDPNQTGRLLRSDPASTCGAPATVSTNDTTVRDYDDFLDTNHTLNAQCVRVTIDAMTCGGLQSAAYAPSFDPASITTNYLGDIGATNSPKTYSFIVGAGQPFVVTVNHPTAGSTCPGYRVTMSSRNPWAITPPNLAGTPAVGSNMLSGTGLWSGSPTFTRQWRRCTPPAGVVCEDIPGATNNNYSVQAADSGSTLKIRMFAHDRRHRSVADSAQSAVVP